MLTEAAGPPRPRPQRARLRRLFLAWLLDGSGVAAVEFALVFPILLVVLVGAVDVSLAVTTSSKVETLSRTLVDLLSQQNTFQVSGTPQTLSVTDTNPVPASVLATIVSASAGLLYPASVASLTITISAIDIVNNASNQCCNAFVRWTYTMPATQPAPAATPLRPCPVQTGPNGLTKSTTGAPSLGSIPTAMLPTATTPINPSISVLIADVQYTYQPIFNVLSFPTLTRTAYMYPRNPGQLVIDGSTMPASGSQYGVVCY